MLGLDLDEWQADPAAYVARASAALGGVEVFAYSTFSSEPGGGLTSNGSTLFFRSSLMLFGLRPISYALELMSALVAHRKKLSVT